MNKKALGTKLKYRLGNIMYICYIGTKHFQAFRRINTSSKLRLHVHLCVVVI